MYDLHPLTSRTRRSQAVADQLLGLLRSGQLPPGARLPTETELCVRFGVSRTTLREAVQTLRARGLLQVSPGRGSFASQPNLKVLMHDVALALRMEPHPPTHDQVIELHHNLLAHACTHALQSPLHERQKLFQYIVVPGATPEVNAQHEYRWQRTFLDLGHAAPISTPLLLLYLNLQPDRTLALTSPEELARVHLCQLHATSALVENHPERLTHTLRQWFNPTVQVSAPTPQAA